MEKSRAGITISHELLDADPMLLGTPNGLVDLRNGIAIAPDPAYLVTQSAGVDFDPDATCPIWERVLAEVFADDIALIQYFQRLCGYFLTGETREHIFCFFIGVGANGKSTLLTILLEILGSYGAQTPAETFLAKKNDTGSNDIARLVIARFVVAQETEDGRALAEALIKSITGGDRITCRALYKDFFEFCPKFKVVMASNYKPRIVGGYAIWRRIHLLPFTVTIAPEKRDKFLIEKLRAELPGVLAWAARGCVEWQRIGLAPPAAVLAATEDYRAEMDVFGDWIDERCIVAPDAMVQCKTAYESHSAWIKECGARPMSMMSFSRKLVERGFRKKKSNVIVFHGIGLQQVAEDGVDGLF